MRTSAMIRTGFTLILLLLLWTNAYTQIRTLNGTYVSDKAMDEFLKQQIDSGAVPGLSIAVINDGKIVFHRAIGSANLANHTRINKSSIFEAASLSKTMFTYFVLRLVDKGILSLDTPLHTYLPYPDIAYDERYKLITARMVLSHTAGFPNWRTRNFADSSRNIPKGDLYLKFKPGTEFSYSGEGYYYLAKVIAQLTKNSLQTLDKLFQREVSAPMGLPYAWFSTNPFITKHKVTGYVDKKARDNWPASIVGQDSTWFGAAGGLHTEALTYAKFLTALMNDSGLSRQSIEEFFKAQVVLSDPADHDGDTAWCLGLSVRPGLTTPDNNHRGDNGNFQSYYRINMERKDGYVFFANSNHGGEFNEKLEAFFKKGVYAESAERFGNTGKLAVSK
ncbi:serine hydrolase domain-containing protein [Pedobacter antarcticus]|uniref:serine hydrolase domain-containing protein n=1 Tax=Pedobacter antarcticus TaxID=34086 RepID=UPI00088AD10F|nr:serine hydrolase domain-containing protein [Pedobacter antarcticus]SDM00111.1 CubicO group peptidase, beta-lactamase class C family [Pedobacter antarcticus]